MEVSSVFLSAFPTGIPQIFLNQMFNLIIVFFNVRKTEMQNHTLQHPPHHPISSLSDLLIKDFSNALLIQRRRQHYKITAFTF